MSIINLGPLNFQNYELVARPSKTFRSSSLGVTGSILLMQDYSPSLKDIGRKVSDLKEVQQFDDEASVQLASEIQQSPQAALDIINQKSVGLRYEKRQEVLRTIPGTKFDKNYLKKNTIRKSLYPFYRTRFPSMEWAYTNYNVLNFYEDRQVPSTSAIIYPAGTGSSEETFYAPSSSFTFDFYIKPKTNNPDIQFGSEVSAGTILHMSGCYAISLVTGSSRDPAGLPDKYRIMLQLSSSANVKPNYCFFEDNSLTASSNTGNTDHLFLSPDNSIPRDRWTHVSITWPGGANNGGTGSFYMNGQHSSNFATTSSIVMKTTSPTPGVDDPNAVFVGNYYYGTNSGDQAIARFFNTGSAVKEGLTSLIDSNEDPTGFEFSNPLRAEIHEIKIFDKYKSERDIKGHTRGFSSIPSDMLFYVPPFFVKESRRRNVMRTPFVEDYVFTDDPFNVGLSFGLGSLDINTENFTREFVRKEYPRMWHLSSSVADNSSYQEGLTANEIIYRNPAARKKLRTILPCDNGDFSPNYELLNSGSDSLTKFVDNEGVLRKELVSLVNMIEGEGLSPGLTVHQLLGRDEEGELISQWENIQSPEYSVGPDTFTYEVVGASPEDPSLPAGSVLSVFQRTGDKSSSEIVVFDISNMFYGDSITPGSVILEDLAPSGSNGSLSFRLKDDGQGNLYRSDIADGSLPAKWATVGNVLYDEGLLVVKSPHLAFFGEHDYRVTFKGERKVHVFEVTVPVESTMHNSSSNPTYQDLKPTDYSNEMAERFNYITGINLHDDNLNVIGKASLSQPFVKREEDRIVIKLRMDF